MKSIIIYKDLTNELQRAETENNQMQKTDKEYEDKIFDINQEIESLKAELEVKESTKQFIAKCLTLGFYSKAKGDRKKIQKLANLMRNKEFMERKRANNQKRINEKESLISNITDSIQSNGRQIESLERNELDVSHEIKVNNKKINELDINLRTLREKITSDNAELKEANKSKETAKRNIIELDRQTKMKENEQKVKETELRDLNTNYLSKAHQVTEQLGMLKNIDREVTRVEDEVRILQRNYNHNTNYNVRHN
jgi:chromosome segregation ATPase